MINTLHTRTFGGNVMYTELNGTILAAPPIMIINRIYQNQNLVAVACFLPGRAKDLSAPLYISIA